jgi:hypothetical protein
MEGHPDGLKMRENPVPQVRDGTPIIIRSDH